MPITWTNPIAPGEPMRAFDIRELRQAIDQKRSAAGLYAFRWTDSVKDGSGVEIGPPAGSPVRAVHLIEMRYALHELRAARGLG